MKTYTLHEIAKNLKYRLRIHKNGNLYPSTFRGVWYKDIGGGQYKKMIDKVPEHNITKDIGL